MAIVITGILGRNGLGRFSLGRVPSSGSSAGVPCPYIPSRLGDLSHANTGPGMAAAAADAHGSRVLSAASHAGRAFISDTLSGMPARTTESAPGRAYSTTVHVSRQPAVADTLPKSTAQTHTHPQKPAPTVESAGQVPLQTQGQAPAKPAPTDEQFPGRRIECR